MLEAHQFGTANIFPRTDGVKGYRDLTPRGGAVYDLFGNGKTAVRMNFGKYLQGVFSGEAYTIKNPATTLVSSITRSWTDPNGDRVAQCDFLNPLANLECGPWSNVNWGASVATTRVNPEVLEGWGTRNSDWQFGVGIQHEILPRMSIDVSYNRRWWNNFFTTHNAALTPADFDEVTITAPQNPRLPGGGGYPVTFLVRNNRNPTLGAGDPYYTTTAATSATRRTTGTAWTCRSARGCAEALFVQAGTSTGRGVNDTCDVLVRTVRAPDGPDGRDRHRLGHRRRSAELRLRRAVADAGARPRQLHRAEGGRARQRDLPLAAQRAAGASHRRHQRRLAHRQLPDDAGAVPGGDRRAAAARPGAAEPWTCWRRAPSTAIASPSWTCAWPRCCDSAASV